MPHGRELYDRGLSASHVFFFSSFSTSNSLHRASISSNFSVFVLFFESPESFASLLSLSFSSCCDIISS